MLHRPAVKVQSSSSSFFLPPNTNNKIHPNSTAITRFPGRLSSFSSPSSLSLSRSVCFNLRLRVAEGSGMGGFLCRAVEVVNDTNPGVELAMAEVEVTETQGPEIITLRPGERRVIKGFQFINRTINSSIQRSVHVTGVLANGIPQKLILEANHFARHGQVRFLIVEGRLEHNSVVIPDLRRLRLSACLG